MPHDSPFLAAVDAFLAHEGGAAPDFSACRVLVAHAHAAQGFRHALRARLPVARYPIIRPPRLTTLADWAGEGGMAVDPDCRRLAELHDVLRRTGHIRADSLWQAAQELLSVLEALDAADLPLAGERYQSWLRSQRNNPYLGLEAGIAEAVWQALRAGTPGRARATGLRLLQLARQADRPLYTLGLDQLQPHERHALEVWAEAQPVRALPLPAVFAERQVMLEAVWRQPAPELYRRAAAWRASHAHSPLREAVTIHAGAGLEAAARAAEGVLLDWLGQGRERIALVALDRLLARRLRALLERRGILVQDETGWAFSTSAVSHVLERWLALAGGPASASLVLDLLRSPYVFSTQGEARQAAAHELAELLRQRLAPKDLAGHVALARASGLAHAAPLLARLEASCAGLATARHPLEVWMRRLGDALTQLEVIPALAADPIGAELLELLTRLERDSAGLHIAYPLADWRRWLLLHLERETFSDAAVDSPVRLTHLGAAVYRDLDGVILLGAGAAHLPAPARAELFNDAARAQLGLPLAQARADQMQAQLITLLAWAPRAALIWQRETEGEPAPLAPWLQALEAFHAAAWQTSLLQDAPAPAPPQAEPMPAPPSAPVLAQAPETLSVSAWQSLVACPYQYFARHVLGLRRADPVEEEMDKAEYGALLHRILAQFHTRHPRLGGHPEAHWQAELAALSASAFAVRARQHPVALAWQARWARRIPAYVAWALARERAGWLFDRAEYPLERELVWCDAPGQHGRTRLYGRADRLERRGDALAVLDYKTQGLASLNRKRKDLDEDVQLGAYAWLAGAGVCGFVALDEEVIRVLEPELAGQSLAERAEAEAARLAGTLAELAAGAPLPAHGAAVVCAHCEMEGLCRRGHRPQPV